MWLNIDKIDIVITDQVTNLTFIFDLVQSIFVVFIKWGMSVLGGRYISPITIYFFFNYISSVYLNKRWFTIFIKYTEVISFCVVLMIMYKYSYTTTTFITAMLLSKIVSEKGI